MELKERVTLDMLTPESVSVLKQQFMTVNGVEMQVGSNERNSFSNTKEDREVLKSLLSEEYHTAIIAVWGEIEDEEYEEFEEDN